MIIKICGLTSLEDAVNSLELGADMLGFNFYQKSPRFLEPGRCKTITTELRRRFPSAKLVGVFVNSEVHEIQYVLKACQLDLAQLCGDEPPADLIRLGASGFKAIRPPSRSSLQQSLGIYPLRNSPPACLIDAYRPGEYGGTGQTADWSLASSVAVRYPILLAGGLTSANVALAIRQVHPWGVDVASGVENSPGVKDMEKVAAFIQAARTGQVAEK